MEQKEPDLKTYDLENDEYGINKAQYIEDQKDYQKEINELKRDQPKLCGLIIQYLSEESLDEVRGQDNWEAINEKADPVGLWKLVERTHNVKTICKMATVTKLAAKTTYKNTRQGEFKSIIAYKE